MLPIIVEQAPLNITCIYTGKITHDNSVVIFVLIPVVGPMKYVVWVQCVTGECGNVSNVRRITGNFDFINTIH